MRFNNLVFKLVFLQLKRLNFTPTKLISIVSNGPFASTKRLLTVT
jgi:hypothetical protein